jgi:hypothetical protein
MIVVLELTLYVARFLIARQLEAEGCCTFTRLHPTATPDGGGKLNHIIGLRGVRRIFIITGKLRQTEDTESYNDHQPGIPLSYPTDLLVSEQGSALVALQAPCRHRGWTQKGQALRSPSKCLASRLACNHPQSERRSSRGEVPGPLPESAAAPVRYRCIDSFERIRDANRKFTSAL